MIDFTKITRMRILIMVHTCEIVLNIELHLTRFAQLARVLKFIVTSRS